MTALGRSWLEQIPPILSEDPDVKAVLHVYSKEAERLASTLASLRLEMFPLTATALTMGIWEASFNLQIAPPGLTLTDRRQLVLTYAQSMLQGGDGADWVATVESLVGTGWSYDEHDPDDATLNLTVPIYTVRVLLPFPANTAQYERARQLVQAITPANIHLILSSSSGFFLDAGQLDADILG